MKLWSKCSVVLPLLVLLGSAGAHASPAASTTSISAMAGGGPATSVAARTAVTLAAAVTAGTASITVGQVRFCDATAANCTGSHLLGIAQLTASGTATFKFIPGPGMHAYKAVFVGTNLYASSSSQPISLTVVTATGPVTSTVGILASGGQGNYSLLATVATSGPASPTGQASFLDTSNADYLLGSTLIAPTGSSGISFRRSFSLPLAYKVPGVPTAGRIATADFNNDGIPDLLMASFSEPTVTLLLGKGDGTFTTSNFPIAKPSSGNVGPVVGDFNSDGKLDFAVTTYDRISVFLGNGDGTFTAGQVLPEDGAYSFIAADVNGDGNIDLVASVSDSSNSNYLQVWFGQGNGLFVPSSNLTQLPSFFPYTLTADFNNDGRADLLLYFTAGVPTILLGNGDGTFTTAPAPPAGSSGAVFITAAVAGDLNGDGVTDLIFSGNVVPAMVLLGKGDGTFTRLPDDPNLAQQTFGIALADFNGDGIPDLVLPNLYGGNTNVFIGKGDGTFIPDLFSPGVADFESASIATADFDGDGQADIAEVFLDLSGKDYPLDELDVLLSQAPNTAAGYANGISPVGTGLHYVKAFYPGDANNLAGTSSTLGLLAQQVPTLLTFSTSPTGSSGAGQTVQLTASLDKFFAQNHSASGTVTFFSNGKIIGTASVANGSATLTTTALPVGTDSLRAVYAGDINFLGSNSATTSFAVTTPQPQAITFPQPAMPAYAGTSITLTASATSGLPVLYKVISGPAYVSGTTLTYTGIGTIVVEADQAGNAANQPAPAVQQTVNTISLTEPVGTSSSTISTVIVIGTTGTLTSIGVLTQGTPNLDFAQAPGGTCTVGTTYVAGQTCTVSFTFTPRLPGIRYGGIVLTGNGGSLLANSYIYGVGVGPLVNYIPGVQSTFASGVNGPTSLAFDGAGNLFVVSLRDHQIIEFSIASGYTASTVISAGLTSPSGIAIDGSGNLFVAESGTASDVKELFSVGGYTSAVTLGSGFLYPTGVAVDGNGNVFVADYYNNAVKEIVAAGGYSSVLTLGSGFFQPVSVAVDSSANLFVADTYHSQVKELSAASGYSNVFTFPGSFPLVSSINVNASGNVFITSNDGTLKEAFPGNNYATTTTLASNLQAPTGVALDGTGNIYLADYYPGNVVKLDFADPPTLQFAPTVIGATSADSPRTVTQINNGTANLVFGVPSSGMNPAISAGFSIATSSTCPQLKPGSAPASLAVGATCTDSVNFTPVAPGAITGTLTTTDNLSGIGSTQIILLNGTGIGAAPSITFSVPNHIYGDPPFSVTATSTSPGTITYSVVSGPATIAGNTVTLTGVGLVTLQASQAASGIYSAGIKQTSFTVSAATPDIAFAVPDHTFGDPPFSITASSSSSGSFTFSVLSGPATISGSTITLTGVGTVTLLAAQSAAGNYTAGTKQAKFNVGAATPSISFTISNHVYGDLPFTVSATSNSPGVLSYTIISGPATITGNTITLTGAGNVTVLASQVSSGNYAAGSQSATFAVGVGTPSITFAVADHTYGDPPFLVTALSNSHGVLTYSVLSGPATISGSTITLTGAGRVNLQVSQAADGAYAAASQTAAFNVAKRDQSITFTAPTSPANFGATLTLTATSTSGLPVVFSVLSGPGSVAGTTLSFSGLGTVIVVANQPGDSNYNPAPQAIRTLVVAGRSAGISLTATPNPVFLQNPVTIAATLAASGATPSGTVSFLDNGAPLGTVVVNGGTAVLTTSSLALGNHAITAIYSGDSNFQTVSSSAVTVVVQDFALTILNPHATITHGGTATYSLLLGSIGGAGVASTITFSVDGAPQYSEITFSPKIVATGSGSTPVTLTIHTPNYPVGPFNVSSVGVGPKVALALLGVGLFFLPRTRKRVSMVNARHLAIALLLTFALGALSGCGSGWRTQYFAIKVTATSGTLSRTATATLTSQCSGQRAACPVE